MSTDSRNHILHALAAKSYWSASTARELVLRNREFEEPLSLRELVGVAQGAFPLLHKNRIRDEIISAVDTPERWELVERLRILADRMESEEFTGVPSAQGTFVTERDSKVFKDCTQPYVIHVPTFKERLSRREKFIRELRKHFREVDDSQLSGERKVVFKLIRNDGASVDRELYVSWLPSDTFEMQYFYDGALVFEQTRTSLKDLISEFKTMLSVSEDLL